MEVGEERGRKKGEFGGGLRGRVGGAVPETGDEVADDGVVDADRVGVDEDADGRDGFEGRSRGGGVPRAGVGGGNGLGPERGQPVREGAGDFPGGVDGVVFFEGLKCC